MHFIEDRRAAFRIIGAPESRKARLIILRSYARKLSIWHCIFLGLMLLLNRA